MTGDAPEQQQQQPSGTHLHVLTDQFGRTHLVREERGGFDGRPTFQIQPATDEAARAADEAARLEAAERRRPAKKGGAVVYEFRPRYPLVARAEDVVGALATSREDALRITLAAFPDLRPIDPARTTFSINTFPGSATQHSARVLDDGWKTLAVELPRRIRIEVADGPGDEEARFQQSLVSIATTTAVVGGVGAAIVLAVNALSGLSKQA